MEKIINSISTIELDTHSKNITIKFEGLGTLFDYNDSFKILHDVCGIHNFISWQIIKKDFKDIDSEKFLMLVFKWCNVNQQHNGKIYRVSLITNPDAAQLMNQQMNYAWWRKHYKIPEVDLTIFSSTEHQQI